MRLVHYVEGYTKVNRNDKFDYYKGILIYLVVLQHVYNLYGFTGNESFEIPIWKWIQIVNMPSFFILSGYFFFSIIEVKFSKLLWKKIKRLIIPWLICGIGVFLSGVVLGNLSLNLMDSLYALKEIWFLPQLFCIMMLMYGINKIPTSLLKALVVAVLFYGAYTGFISISFVSMVSFFVGMLFKQISIGNVLDSISIKRIAIPILLIGHLLGYSIYYFLDYQIVHIFISVVLSATFLLVLHCFFKHNFYNEMMLRWGRHSLALYLIQKIVVEIWVFRVFHKICVFKFEGRNPLVYNQLLFEYVWAILLAICLCTICFVVYITWEFFKLKWRTMDKIHVKRNG